MRSGSGLKILYVENDMAFINGVAERFLAGHEVAAAPSLRAARMILDRPWDVILVDYDLDDGKGDTLVRELRAAGDATIVIGVSARATGNRNILIAGADAVCAKADIEHISEMIEQIGSEKEALCGG